MRRRVSFFYIFLSIFIVFCVLCFSYNLFTWVQYSSNPPTFDTSPYLPSLYRPDLPYVTFQSTPEDVLRIMGEPDRRALDDSEWYYGDSYIFFIDNQVWTWDIEKHPLRVSLGRQIPGDTFSKGSSEQQVVAAMGTPTRFNRDSNVWYYGNSSIVFDNNGLVDHWNNKDHNLKIK